MNDTKIRIFQEVSQTAHDMVKTLYLMSFELPTHPPTKEERVQITAEMQFFLSLYLKVLEEVLELDEEGIKATDEAAVDCKDRFIAGLTGK